MAVSAVVPTAILANALATCAAVAPLAPAVKVSPATLRESPAVRLLKVTAPVSVTAAEPSVVAIRGAEASMTRELVKLDTFVLVVVLVKVTEAPLVTPVFHSAADPTLNTPPAASPKFFARFFAAAVSPELMFAKALATCTAEAPLAPAVKVKPSIDKA